VKWTIVYTKQAQKDAKKLASAGLRGKAEELLRIIGDDPYQTPPSFEKLVGDLQGAYSRRINIQHRLVYEVFAQERTVRILRIWTHYE
jgi:toxin-antitoxin system, toxin component, Txe/YoeB family